MMKRLCWILLCAVVIFATFTACGGNPDGSTPSVPETTTTTVATTTTTTTTSPNAGIPFTVKANVKCTQSRNMIARILLSGSQVEEAKLNELTWDGKDAEKIDTSEYIDAYFTDKALVLLYLSEPSASSQLEFDSVVVSEKRLTVSYTAKKPIPAVSEGATRCFLLAVKRADVAGVTEIVGNRTEATLYSGDNPETNTTTSSETEIPFTVREQIQLAGGRQKENGFLRNSQQLADAKLELIPQYSFSSSGWDYVLNTAEYTDEFFADKALLEVYSYGGSSSYRVRVDRLTVDGNTLTVQYAQISPGPGSTMPANHVEWFLLLEVSQKDIQGVTNIVLEVTKETILSGQKLE